VTTNAPPVEAARIINGRAYCRLCRAHLGDVYHDEDGDAIRLVVGYDGNYDVRDGVPWVRYTEGARHYAERGERSRLRDRVQYESSVVGSRVTVPERMLLPLPVVVECPKCTRHERVAP
jgi:hypothetical protein